MLLTARRKIETPRRKCDAIALRTIGKEPVPATVFFQLSINPYNFHFSPNVSTSSSDETCIEPECLSNFPH